MAPDQKSYFWRTLDRVVNIAGLAGIISILGFIYSAGELKQKFENALSNIQQLFVEQKEYVKENKTEHAEFRSSIAETREAVAAVRGRQTRNGNHQ